MDTAGTWGRRMLGRRDGRAHGKQDGKTESPRLTQSTHARSKKRREPRMTVIMRQGMGRWLQRLRGRPPPHRGRLSGPAASRNRLRGR
eukprot:scaffold8679_cov121-Isochrysis_galbana.AAC.12